jgi:hypothetical protein
MAPGNAWHLPVNAEFPGNAGMRSPLFPTTATKQVTIFSGNQYAGGGQAADQIQEGSAVIWKKSTDTWQAAETVGLRWTLTVDNNKYFSAQINIEDLPERTIIQYYLVIAYNQNQPQPTPPRELTFLSAAQEGQNWFLSNAIVDRRIAEAQPFRFTIETPEERGEWGPRFNIGNVGAHASLLRTGQVLMWGRRDNEMQSMNTNPATSLGGLNGPPAPAATCVPWLLNPPYVNTERQLTGQPTMPGSNVNANLFCAGHTFDPEGNLIAAGGHLEDSNGLATTHIYEPRVGGIGTWRNSFQMRKGRWYPTVTALPLGTALITEGTYMENGQTLHNNDSQHWSENMITSLAVDERDRPADTGTGILDLYPRIHVASTGLIYSLSLQTVKVLDMSEFNVAPPKTVRWVDTNVVGPYRDYGCTVMYEKDKVLFVGGGVPPLARVDSIDLSDSTMLAWKQEDPMTFRRRQHNATVLPDGTVLVTGGTRGDGNGETVNPDDVRFNDLRTGQPIHVAELWDPMKPRGQQWTMMASEETDRCYHATAVLLPDATVLSAGGGEFQLGRTSKIGNPAKDSHRDAQIFSPPYLFRGPRPVITSSPQAPVEHNAVFDIGTPMPNQISKVSLVGLSSVTHSVNSGQRLLWLQSEPRDGVLKVTAPLNSKICPPGWYMLFVLNGLGVPSIARFIQIVSPQNRVRRHQGFVAAIESVDFVPPTVLEVRSTVREATQGNTRIEIGITPTCPYGLSACWGGAFETLAKLKGVANVDPIPHASGSTASVFLPDNRLPNIGNWTTEFRRLLQASYGLRGFEAAITGTVEKRDNGKLVIVAEGDRPEIDLEPLTEDAKIQMDLASGRPQSLTDAERNAYEALKQTASPTTEPLRITGPLSQVEEKSTIQVRLVDST